MTETAYAKRGSFAQWWYEFCGGVPPQYKKDFDDYKIATNLFRTLIFSSFIIFIQIFLNIINMLLPSSSGEAEIDIMKFVYLSLFALCVGVVSLIISLIIKKGHLKNRRFRQFFPYVLVYLYCLIQMIFLSFNVQSEAGMNSYIISLIILGFFLVMRPIQYIISIGVFFVLALGVLGFAGADHNALGAIMATDTWANLLIITCLIAVMSCVFYKMFLTNFLSHKQLEISNERLDKLARTDELTGMLNRWGFFAQIDEDWLVYHQGSGIIAVFMFDLDYFKEYNDTYGHPAGDECLRQVARSMAKFFTKKENGLVCRYGGEEFLVVIRTDSEEKALRLADAMKKDLHAESKKLIEGSEGVTLSGGVAVLPTGNEVVALDMLIDCADKTLYEAKEQGRDQIITANTIELLQ